MIKTPLSTVIGGAGIWTPEATIIGGTSKTLNQLIKPLFSNGEQGFFYNPNDLSTMFQDSAGTVPVTGVGQPVGLIRDKSGRNNHARQTNSASRPILRQNAVTGAYYLEFDGSDDFLQTSNIDFTSTDEVSLFAGVRKLSDASIGMLAELSASAATNNGSFYIITAFNTTTAFRFHTKGSNGGATSIASPASAYAGQTSVVLSVKSKTAASSQINLRVNQSNYQSVNTEALGNYGNYPLYIGRRAGITYTFKGHIYSLIGVGRLTTGGETVAIEKELAKRTGVTLNV